MESHGQQIRRLKASMAMSVENARASAANANNTVQWALRRINDLESKVRSLEASIAVANGNCDRLANRLAALEDQLS